MRITKGRPIFGFKDTYCADSTLSPIIASWLRKYLSTVTEPGHDFRKGVPGSVAHDYIGRSDTQSDEEFEYCWSKFVEEVEEMIWAFDPGEEPCYRGGYHEGTEHGKETVRPSGAKTYRWDMQVNDQSAWNEAQQARKEWHERRQRGFDLFAKRFNNLWW